MGLALGHPLWATLASLAISAICVIAVLIAIRAPLPVVDSLADQPKWVWIGGVAGVVYITAAIILTPKLGAAGFMTAIIAGQVIASLVIDYFGAVGLAVRPVDTTRLAGVAMVMLRAVVIQWPALSRM